MGDPVWKALDFWLGLSAFVAREARRGVCDGVDLFWILSALVECEVRRGVL